MELSKHAKRVAVGEYFSSWDDGVTAEDVYDQVMNDEGHAESVPDWEDKIVWDAHEQRSLEEVQDLLESLAQTVQEAINEAVKEALAKRGGDGVTGD